MTPMVKARLPVQLLPSFHNAVSWSVCAITAVALVMLSTPAEAMMQDAGEAIMHPMVPSGLLQTYYGHISETFNALIQAFRWFGTGADWLWTLGFAAAGIALGSIGRELVIRLLGWRERRTIAGKIAYWIGREAIFFVGVAVVFANLPPWPHIHGLSQTIAISWGLVSVVRCVTRIVLRFGQSRNYAIVRAIGNATAVMAVGYVFLGLLRLSGATAHVRVLTGLLFWVIFLVICAVIIIRSHSVAEKWRTVDIVSDPVSALLLGQRSLFFGVMLLLIGAATIVFAFNEGPRAYVDGTLSMALLALLPTMIAVIPDFVGRISHHFGPWQVSLVRCARLLIFIAFWAVLASIWGIDPFVMASTRAGQEVARVVIDVCIAIALAYLLWELISTSLDIIALPLHSAIPSENDDHLLRATRLQTFVPLMRTLILSFIIAATGMIALAAIGVNIGPLLAGAGIVGVAIGFGSQSLVKDVISGIFFLADDAFRIGEYLEVGAAKGTVEAISVRSLKLRHPRGALFTVPFGSISMVNNQSRDYVIVKLEFIIAFESDLAKAKKLVKAISAVLESDPELSAPLLQPIKFQGVRRMEQYGMVVGVKFTARPGEQWMLRREVFQRVRDAFQEAGIAFARPQVIVQVPGGAQLPPEAIEAVAGFVASEKKPGELPADDGNRR